MPWDSSSPSGWVVDVEGRPTTDPGAFLAGGALTPMAGHKGYGLALLIETLAAVLTGAAMTRQVVPWIVGRPLRVRPATAPRSSRSTSAAMMPIDAFKRRVDALASEIRESPLAEGSDRVYLPGEIEWERRTKSLAEGIVLPDDVWVSVAELARELDIAPGFAQRSGAAKWRAEIVREGPGVFRRCRAGPGSNAADHQRSRIPASVPRM